MKKIVVLGLGKVGTLASELLHNSGFEVTGIDLNAKIGSLPFEVKFVDLSSTDGISAKSLFSVVRYCT